MSQHDEGMRKFWERNAKELRLFAGVPKEAQDWADKNRHLPGWHIRRSIDGKMLSLHEQDRLMHNEVYALVPNKNSRPEDGFVIFDIDKKTGLFLDSDNDIIMDDCHHWYEPNALVLDIDNKLSHFCGYQYEGDVDNWTNLLLGYDSDGGITEDMDEWVKPATPIKGRFYRTNE